MLKKLFSTSVPPQYRSNFIHMYFDIGWFGVLSGSSVNFLNVYATRLGASGFQIGLLGAMSAVVSLVFAIPAGRWLEKQATGRAVFWSAVVYRIGFLLFVPLPWLLGAQGQIWALIALAFFMGVPLVALSVGFSTLFAEAVPIDWRAHVAGIRNVVLSVMYMLSSLLSGYLLDRVAFPANYQIVFLIGFIGAAMSCVHLYFIRPLPETASPAEPALKAESARPAETGKRDWRKTIRMDIWSTPFRFVLLGMFAFHFSQYLAIPLFPIYSVRNLRLTDEMIGIGTALFYLAMLLGSTQLSRMVSRLGHKTITGWGVVGMAAYPILIAASSQPWHYYGVSLIGGLVWALVAGAYVNYILEKTPENDRPAYLAWYNIILNACILIGSLAGPAVADIVGLPAALVAFGVLRFLAGMAILRWG